jgi:hypothetical protein
MSDELKLRIVGLCILAAFPLFGGGQALLESKLHRLGLLMCLSYSVAVITARVSDAPNDSENRARKREHLLR